MPPEKTSDIFFTNVSKLLDTRKDAIHKTSPNTFFCAKIYQTVMSGFQGTPYFSRCGRDMVSKPAISLKKTLWGTNIERLGE